MSGASASGGKAGDAAGWRALVQPGARRSFALMAAGAALGLGAAGFALFTAKGTATHTLPPEDVALVNQRPVLRSDFVTQTEAASGLPFAATPLAVKRKTLQDMLREELFVQRGLELDLAASDPDVRAALVAGVERQVEAGVTAQEPSEAQLRAAYAAHLARYMSLGRMTVHDLTAAPGRPGGDLAAAALALAERTPLPAVEARYGLVDGRRDVGEEFYYAARIHLGEPLFAAAAPLRDGQAAGPILAGGAPHLLYMEHNQRPVQQSFADARDQVLKEELEAARRRVERADETYLHEKADILLAPEYR